VPSRGTSFLGSDRNHLSSMRERDHTIQPGSGTTARPISARGVSLASGRPTFRSSGSSASRFDGDSSDVITPVPSFGRQGRRDGALHLQGVREIVGSRGVTPRAHRWLTRPKPGVCKGIPIALPNCLTLALLTDPHPSGQEGEPAFGSGL